jgi:glycosyltransferase involved in cell wall biosynthesis
MMMKMRLIPKAPVLIAPNGECAPPALEISRWKKLLLRRHVNKLMPRDLAFHATSPVEVDEIKEWLERLNFTLVEAPHPAPAPLSSASHGSGAVQLNVAYLSRIHPNKGLQEAIQSLASCEIDCTFDIYGVVDDATYWESCQEALSRLPKNINWRIRGPYQPADVIDVVSSTDLVLMPTRGESFGRAIAETLAVGCPIVLSSKTLWTSTVQSGGWVADSVDEMASAISAAVSESPTERKVRRQIVLGAYTAWYTDNMNRFTPFPAWQAIHQSAPRQNTDAR